MGLKKARGPEPIMTSDSSATSEEIVSVFVDVSAESVATLQVNGHLTYSREIGKLPPSTHFNGYHVIRSSLTALLGTAYNSLVSKCLWRIVQSLADFCSLLPVFMRSTLHLSDPLPTSSQMVLA
jgi:hypothetical protein